MNRWHILPLVGGGAVGLIFVIFFTWYATLTAPSVPVINGDPEVWRGANGTIYIKIPFISEAQPSCIRIVQYILTRDISNGRREYVGLDGSLTGRGLKGSIYDYDILRWVPPDFPSGEWVFLTRLHHQCQPLGLIRWEHTLPPVTIRIPE
jgi:hypothetical protein